MARLFQTEAKNEGTDHQRDEQQQVDLQKEQGGGNDRRRDAQPQQQSISSVLHESSTDFGSRTHLRFIEATGHDKGQRRIPARRRAPDWLRPFRAVPASVGPSPAPALIAVTGTYKNSSRPEELEIWLDERAIVRYQVTDQNTKKILLSGTAGGNFSRWHFLWSADSRLWIYSGDLGCVVWLPDNGSYKQVTLADDDELLRQMPTVFFEALPDALKQRWAGSAQMNNPESPPTN